METKTTFEEINLLTKSDKYGGYCIVGLRCRDNKLVRLVSPDYKTRGAIEKQTLRRRGYTMKPTDRVRVPIYCELKERHQPENCLIDPAYNWNVEASTMQEDVLEKCPIRHTGTIFGTTGYRLWESEMPDHSIEMVEVQNFSLFWPNANRRPKASFLYNGIQYRNMSFTDPDFSFEKLDPSYYTESRDGSRCILHRAVLVVSLPSFPFEKDGFYYIFVAKVFPLPPQD